MYFHGNLFTKLLAQAAAVNKNSNSYLWKLDSFALLTYGLGSDCPEKFQTSSSKM